MNARLTMFLRAFVVGCCVVAFTAVAQTEQQRTDEHHDNGQQRPAEQNAGHNGVNRPQQQQQGAQPYRGEHPPEQGQQYQTQQQPGQNNGQSQYHPQPQQRGQSNSAQQQNGHYRPQQQQSGQQYQQHGNQQYEQRGDQQHRADSNRGGQQYRSNNRPQQWGHAPAHRPTFNFRSNDRGILQRYYASRLHGIDRAHRPVFRIGGYLPYEDLGFFAPVPPGAWGSLPPIPYGYEAGYWDGYVVVYDPNTGYILYVADLL